MGEFGIPMYNVISVKMVKPFEELAEEAFDCMGHFISQSIPRLLVHRIYLDFD